MKRERGKKIMVRYNLQIAHGDNNIVKKYYFINKNWQTLTKEETDKAFDSAVKELDRIYKTYGRFATEVGILRLFDSFGFEVSKR